MLVWSNTAHQGSCVCCVKRVCVCVPLRGQSGGSGVTCAIVPTRCADSTAHTAGSCLVLAAATPGVYGCGHLEGHKALTDMCVMQSSHMWRSTRCCSLPVVDAMAPTCTQYLAAGGFWRQGAWVQDRERRHEGGTRGNCCYWYDTV